jgi:GT2 family glycosyltransferase
MQIDFTHITNQPLVSIITVNYNQATVTVELLKSLQNISYSNIEVIVVDNASTENSNSVLENFPKIQYIKSSTNLGFAGGNNLGLKNAKGDYILFINNDVEVEPSFLEPLLNKMLTDSSIAAVSPKIKYFFNPNYIQYAGSFAVHPLTLRNGHRGTGELDYGQYNISQRTAYAHGACMLVSKNVIEKIGTMNEQFFLYYEEQDWCERINHFGYQIYFIPQSVVYHKESISTGKNSPLKTYYLSRNRILFARKNYRGLVFIISMLYLVFVSIPKNTVSLFFKKQKLTAYFNGILWNLKNKTTFNY